uniref:Uncharacterized protein n=1 Tax=Lotharella oceanica TaxID=641309 RepID=A0A7S2TWQ1_9EUKA
MMGGGHVVNGPARRVGSRTHIEFCDGRILSVLHQGPGKKLSMLFPQLVRASYGERIWKGVLAVQELELKCRYDRWPSSVAFSPDGKHIAIGNNKKSAPGTSRRGMRSSASRATLVGANARGGVFAPMATTSSAGVTTARCACGT